MSASTAMLTSGIFAINRIKILVVLSLMIAHVALGHLPHATLG
jgi:hypothetical protein